MSRESPCPNWHRNLIGATHHLGTCARLFRPTRQSLLLILGGSPRQGCCHCVDRDDRDRIGGLLFLFCAPVFLNFLQQQPEFKVSHPAARSWSCFSLSLSVSQSVSLRQVAGGRPASSLLPFRLRHHACTNSCMHSCMTLGASDTTPALQMPGENDARRSAKAEPLQLRQHDFDRIESAQYPSSPEVLFTSNLCTRISSSRNRDT